MHRRGHRKSRNGCLECKRRHMKCDETRPQCANCTTVRRVCQYADPQGPSFRPPGQAPSSASTSPAGTASPASSPRYTAGSLVVAAAAAAAAGTPSSVATSSRGGDDRSTPGASAADALSVAYLCSQDTDADESHGPLPEDGRSGGGGGGSSSSRRRRDSSSGADATSSSTTVNIAHAELAFHFSLAIVVPDLDANLVAMGTKVVVDASLRAPYLLYECLAISARYLSVLRPAQHAFYYHQAVQLQTQAIAMYKATDVFDDAASASASVPSILFSSLLNCHSLVDVFANRDGGFGAFLDRYMQTVQLQRGIRAVSQTAWPQLLASELRPILDWSMPETLTAVGAGPEFHDHRYHCDELRQLVALTPTLNPVSKEACRTAIHYLQLGYDCLAQPVPGKYANRMLSIWGIFLPDEFCTLLRARQPEAVAIMAWYAVLLHEERNSWRVGDVGVFILQNVSEFLGPQWAHWLEWPTRRIRGSL
ncbi:Zn(2)-C6 fungal-type DNA-binding domain protein [Niveomyces insectorum RCEF 264]|uniref:Zn(2)-C6 fungal-type DNA-binding domain protein n=1 Tax=Niveomyces insectorum RCEF 264 TaxID=1081102 RepID=A0A162MH33_9HYPO|nr:Zn(2)-C6 fungal-type DNA-binding domain protein [Niveomyces insectorum RCEF 264]